MITCRDCEYFTNFGRCNSQQYKPGRKLYKCRHPKVSEIPKKDFGNSMDGFIGYGKANSFDSPLEMKTTPRWCPKKKYGG